MIDDERVLAQAVDVLTGPFAKLFQSADEALQQIASDSTSEVSSPDALTAMAGIYWQLNIDSTTSGEFCSSVQAAAMARG